MIVTESAVESVLVVGKGGGERARVSHCLKSVGLYVIETDTTSQAMTVLRFHAGSIDWLVADSSVSDACTVLQIVLEYQWYNPLRPVICLTSEEISPALRRVPGLVALSRPVSEQALTQVVLGVRADRDAAGFGA